MAESEEELKSFLKVDLKLNIQKTKIMASGPITSWQIDGKTVETVTDLILRAPKSLQMVTAAMKLYFPDQGLNPGPPALGVESSNHWM